MNHVPKTGVSIFEHFGNLTDPRIDRNQDHKLLDIVGLSICGVICGADGWTEIEEFGKSKENWLRSFLELPNGIPSHDTIGRVFARLLPGEFQHSFQSWIQSISGSTEGQIISIDGKTLRRSYDRSRDKATIHMVSAWASENHLILGQVKTSEKSHEITAIPRLLEVLAINGCIVTLDAMGCQTDIAKQIVERGLAPYCPESFEKRYTLSTGSQNKASQSRMGQWLPEEPPFFRGLNAFALIDMNVMRTHGHE